MQLVLAEVSRVVVRICYIDGRDPILGTRRNEPRFVRSCVRMVHFRTRQRLQPGGRIIVVMTRWSVADLTGKLIKAQKEPKADQWEVIEFPAILPSGKPVWPGYWKIEELEAVKASVSTLNGTHSTNKAQHRPKEA